MFVLPSVSYILGNCLLCLYIHLSYYFMVFAIRLVSAPVAMCVDIFWESFLSGADML